MFKQRILNNQRLIHPRSDCKKWKFLVTCVGIWDPLQSAATCFLPSFVHFTFPLSRPHCWQPPRCRSRPSWRCSSTWSPSWPSSYSTSSSTGRWRRRANSSPEPPPESAESEEKTILQIPIPTAFSNTRSTIFCDVYQILPDTFHFLLGHLSARRSHKSVPCWEYIPNRTITIFIILLFQVLCGNNPDHHCCDVRSLSQLQSFHQRCRAYWNHIR